MFGVSFWKIVLLVAVSGAIWSGFRWFERAQADKARIAARQARPDRARDPGAQDLVACRICGAFVAEGAARACGRSDCPYPR